MRGHRYRRGRRCRLEGAGRDLGVIAGGFDQPIGPVVFERGDAALAVDSLDHAPARVVDRPAPDIVAMRGGTQIAHLKCVFGAGESSQIGAGEGVGVIRFRDDAAGLVVFIFLQMAVMICFSDQLPGAVVDVIHPITGFVGGDAKAAVLVVFVGRGAGYVPAAALGRADQFAGLVVGLRGNETGRGGYNRFRVGIVEHDAGGLAVEIDRRHQPSHAVVNERFCSEGCRALGQQTTSGIVSEIVVRVALVRRKATARCRIPELHRLRAVAAQVVEVFRNRRRLPVGQRIAPAIHRRLAHDRRAGRIDMLGIFDLELQLPGIGITVFGHPAFAVDHVAQMAFAVVGIARIDRFVRAGPR